jgi:site-specific DNA-methyltransferase (adenine-specific)
LHRAEKLVRKKKWDQRKSKTVTLPTTAVEIIHSDFRNLQIDEGSVDLVLTDPPYDKDALPLWDDLGLAAARWLRPGGVLLAYTGFMYLNEVFRMLEQHLTWHWQEIIIHDSHGQLVHSRNVINKYRSVLGYVKGTASFPAAITDVIYGSGPEKTHHPWQQNLGEFEELLEYVTEPNDLVVDPFGGGFTTAVACYNLGRRCISCDVDQLAVEGGRERLAQVQSGESDS